MQTRAFHLRSCCLALSLTLAFSLPVAWAQQQQETAVTGDEGGPLPVPIAYGQGTSGFQINTTADADNFMFECSAGHNIRVTVSGRSNNLDPALEVKEPPAGNVLAQGACSAGAFDTCSFIVNATCNVSGTHQLTVSESGGDNTGSYTLQLERVPFLPPPSYGAGFPYASNTGTSLSPHPDLDLFHFKARTGTSIDVTVSGATNNLDPRLEIWDPIGTLIAVNSCSAGAFNTCSFVENALPITLSGTHFLGISESGADNIGNYNVSLQCNFGVCPFGYFLKNLIFETKTEINWDPVLDGSAATYDVVQGDLNTLNSSGGDFSSAVTGCLSTGNQLPTADALDDPNSGEEFFYVVRAVSDVGPGFYDTAVPSQAFVRDTLINTSPNSCAAPSSSSDRFYRVSCTMGNWCKYQVTNSENNAVVPTGVTINARADAGTTACPPLQQMFEDDWAFDPDMSTACAADPDVLVGGDWVFVGGPVSTPEVIFADCWARCAADGGDL